MFLDEPTAGLDPPSRARMWQEVRRLRDEGMTIFLTTHYLDEADALCDRISIIDAGLIVAEGTPSDLKREISGDVVVVDLAAAGTAGVPEPATMLQASKVLAEQPYVELAARPSTTRCGSMWTAPPRRSRRSCARSAARGSSRERSRPAGRAWTTCSWPRPAASD